MPCYPPHPHPHRPLAELNDDNPIIITAFPLVTEPSGEALEKQKRKEKEKEKEEELSIKGKIL